MAGEKLPLGIRFTARDVETANITSEVQKAINTAIANTNTKQLSKKFKNAPISITATLSKETKNIIAKDVQSALNKVSLTFTDKNVKTKGLINKVRRGVGHAISNVGMKEFGKRLYNAALKVRNGINVALNSAKFSDLSKRLQQQLSKPVTVQVGKIKPTKDAVIKLKGQVDGKTLSESLRALDGKYSVLIRAKVQGLKEAISRIQKEAGGAPVTGGAKQAQDSAKANQALAQSRQKASQAAVNHANATNKESIAQRSNTKSTKIGTDGVKQFHQALSPTTKATNQMSASVYKLADAQRKNSTSTQMMYQPFDKTRAMTDSLSKSFQEAGFNAEILGTRIAQIAKRFSGFFIYTAALFKFMEALRETTQAVQDLDRTAASLGKVLKDLSEKDIDAVNNQLIEMAINTKRAYGEAATAMENFARQGLSTKDSIAATKGVLDLLNISTVDAATASKLIITTFNAFNGDMQELTKTLATFSDLADASAIDVVDLAQGFIRSASAANAFGVSQEQLAASIATVGGVTQMQATRIGTGFKTIFSYLAGSRVEVLELAASFRGMNKTTGELDSEFNSLMGTLEFLAQGWGHFSKAQRQAIGQMVGGKRRLNELAALLGNFDRYQKLYTQALEESNSVQRKSGVESETLAAAHRKLGTSLVRLAKLFTDIGATDFYKDIVNGLSSIIQTTAIAIKGLDTLSNLVEGAKGPEISIGIDGEVVEKEISMVKATFLDFTSSALSGTNLLSNAFIYMFAKVLLPQIRKGTNAFKSFLTGSEKGINKILANQAGYTEEVQRSVGALDGEKSRLTGILETEKQILQTRQRSAGAAGARTFGGGALAIQGAPTGGGAQKTDPFTDKMKGSVQSLVDFNGRIKASADAQKNNAAVLKAHKGAQDAYMQTIKKSIEKNYMLNNKKQSLAGRVKNVTASLRKFQAALTDSSKLRQLASKKNIQKATAPIGALGGKAIGKFKKGMKAVGTKFGKFKKSLVDGNAKMIGTIAGMQALGAVGSSLSKTAKKLEKDSENFGTNFVEATGAISSSIAPLMAFGWHGALAGAIMGSFSHIVSEVNKHMEAKADWEKQVAKANLDHMSAIELATAAQNDYLLQLGLVRRGMGEFVKNIQTGEKEFKINFEKLKGGSAAMIRASGLGEFKKTMNSVIQDAAKLAVEWDDINKSMSRAIDQIAAFEDTATKVAAMKIDLDMNNTRKMLGYASEDLAALMKQSQQLEQAEIKFLAPAPEHMKDFGMLQVAKSAKGVMQELFDMYEKVQAGELLYEDFMKFYDGLQIVSAESQLYERQIGNMKDQQGELRNAVDQGADALKGSAKSSKENAKSTNKNVEAIRKSAKALKEAKSAYDFVKVMGDSIDKLVKFKKKVDAIRQGMRYEWNFFDKSGTAGYEKLFKANLRGFKKIQKMRGKSTKNAEKQLRKIVSENAAYKKNKKAVQKLKETKKKAYKEAKKKRKEASSSLDNLNAKVSERKEIFEEVKNTQKESTLELIRQMYEVNEQIKTKIEIQRNSAKIQIAENNVLQRSADLARSIKQEMAFAGKEMSVGLNVAIKTREELQKSEIAVKKLAVSRKKSLKDAREKLGPLAASSEIKQLVDIQIKEKLRNQIEDIIGTFGDKLAQETERITQLEKERFNVAKEQLKKLAEMERRRSEISEEMTSSLLDSATEMGATDVEIGALLDSSVVADQLDSINNKIKDKLNNQAKVQLAYSLEQISIEEQKQKAILDAQIKRANEEEKVALEVKRATVEKNFAEKRSIEIMDVLKRSSVEAFNTIKSAADAMRGSLNNIRNLRNDIMEQDKKISKLQAQIKYDEQIKGLEAQKKSLQSSLNAANAFAKAIDAVERKNNTMADALVSSEQYFEDVAESVGGLKSLGDTLNMTKIQIETAKKSLGGFARQFANILKAKKFTSLQKNFGGFRQSANTPKKFGLFEDKIQELRVNSAKETVSRLQEEYKKLQTYGEQLYSADFGKLYKMAAAQSAIENATGNLNEKLQKVPAFLRDAAAAYVKRQYGEEGEQAVAKAGLERAGIDSDQLESLEKQTVDAAKESVKAQFELLELQKKSNNAGNIHATKIQSQISEVNEKIKAAEEAKESAGSMDQTLKEQLRDARERKKFLQNQIAQEAKHYSQNAKKIDKLIPGVDSMTQGIPKQIDRLDKIHDVLKGQDIATELAKVMQPFQKLISDVSTQATGGETATDAGAFANQMKSTVLTPLNRALVKHKKNIDFTNTQIGKLKEIYNNQSVSANTMIEQINKVIAKTKTVLEADIKSAIGEEEAAVDDTGVLEDFSEALNEGMALKENTIDAQKKATKSAVTDGMKETNKKMDNVVDATEGVAKANEKLGKFVKEVGNGVVAVGGSISNKLTPAVQSVATAVAGIVIKVTKIVQNFGASASTEGGGEGSSFAGLNNMEMAGVISAAKREKSKMPSGSNLTVANTSELIMTPKQAKKIFGQVQMPDGVRNVQKHMYGAQKRKVVKEKEKSPSKDIAKLTNKINDLLDSAEKKELFNNKQDISINVDGKREISLKGVKSFKKELQDTFKKQMANVSSRAELNAVRGTLENLIRRLRETGVDGV